MPKGIPNKRYTPEFKQLVVETMHKERLSIRETSAQFEISDHNAVARWERIYLMEGPEGLAIERRGRGREGRPSKFPKEVEDNLFTTTVRIKASRINMQTPRQKLQQSSMKIKVDTGIVVLQMSCVIEDLA